MESEDERRLWSLRIDEARDLEELDAIEDVLRSTSAAWARPLRFKGAARRVALRRKPGAERLDAAFASAYGLPAPTGAPLYRYKLGDASFHRLEAEVADALRTGRIERGDAPGLFVLWSAEWFRRCYRGQGHEWDTLIAALGAESDHDTLRRVTEGGLAMWKRPLRGNLRGRSFLGSLAREGGFPVAAVEAGGRGWARDALAAIVAPLMANPAAGQEEAEALALAQRERISAKLYQDEEFALLCADLAIAIVLARREAEPAARGAGLPLAAWLQAHRPDWRAALPLSVSGPAAEALLGDLLLVEAAEAAAFGGGAERLLVRDERGDWAEAARIGLDGAVDAGVMAGIDPIEGRLRAFAAGDLARHVPGELAMIEPPAEGEKTWAARSTKRARGVLHVPFAAAIELDLRSGEQRVARVTLRGGKPRRGRLLVCTVAEGSEDAPRVLKAVASGAALLVADTAVVQAPADWRVLVVGEGEVVTPLGRGVGDTCLWRVVGGALVTDPSGDGYRIRTGQTRDRRDRLELDGETPSWAVVSGDVDLFCGPPAYRTSDPTRGAVFIRSAGTRNPWRPVPRPLPVGHHEIAWRDGTLLLDRRRIAVLPASATLTRTGRGREACYRLAGWEGAGITPVEGAPVRVTADGWRARPMGRATFWFDARIDWPGAPPLSVRVGFPQDAAIASWDGTVLPADARVTLAELRDLVAVDEGRMRMFGELVERGGQRQPAVMTWEFDAELPLSSAAADIASMLLPASNDAAVKIGMLDGIETYWYVRPFAIRTRRESGGLVAVEGVVAPGVEICGRAFVDPARERRFGAYSLLVEANHRPFVLPSDAKGDWMVYLRDGPAVVSRPEILTGQMPVGTQTSPLARAMATPPWEGLTEALHDVLAIAAGEDAAAERTVGELLALVCSLRGLPPSSFEVLRLLPAHPALLARMALAANAEQRDAVLALSDTLPFAWCLIPKACWKAAGDRRFDALMTAMAAVEGAAGFAMQAMADVAKGIAEREPLLAPVLIGARPDASRQEVEQVFVRRVTDRAERNHAGSRYRDRGLALPADHLLLPDKTIEWLDTPSAAALAVVGDWTPDADDVRHIKTVARTFPTFFADAFAANLQELS